MYLNENEEVEEYTIESLYSESDFRIDSLKIGSSKEEIESYIDSLKGIKSRTNYTNVISCILSNGYKLTLYWLDTNTYGGPNGLYKVSVKM